MYKVFASLEVEASGFEFDIQGCGLAILDVRVDGWRNSMSFLELSRS